MGLLDRLFAFFSRPENAGRPASTPTHSPPRARQTQADETYTTDVGGIKLTVSVSMPGRPHVEVEEAEVSRAIEPYRFVLANPLPPLKTIEQWWSEDVHKRRLKEGSPKALAWLEPFVPVELAQRLQLKAATNPWGPMAANGLAKELRGVIRERRKAAQPYADELRALYGACLLEGFVKGLSFEFVQPRQLASCLALSEVHGASLDYYATGYLHVATLGKTDAKWLVEQFGEPTSHVHLADAFANLYRQAVTRYCWTELMRDSSYSSKDATAMERWLRKRVEINLRILKENAVFMADRATRQEHRNQFYERLPQAWEATDGTFIVADLETSGLSSETDHILEFGAVRADSDGRVLGAYSALVNADCEVPPIVTRLTGLTKEELSRTGQPLRQAFNGFADFVAETPVFFHNAHFDQGFLNEAAKKVGRSITAPVYDTLPMAQQAFPQAASLKLVDLAAQVGATATHRALSDAHAALAVLMAAKRQMRASADA
jgi:DNA polymerase III epsilon subunit-like protein